jgi:hypothetical protein
MVRIAASTDITVSLAVRAYAGVLVTAESSMQSPDEHVVSKVVQVLDAEVQPGRIRLPTPQEGEVTAMRPPAHSGAG